MHVHVFMALMYTSWKSNIISLIPGLSCPQLAVLKKLGVWEYGNEAKFTIQAYQWPSVVSNQPLYQTLGVVDGGVEGGAGSDPASVEVLAR